MEGEGCDTDIIMAGKQENPTSSEKCLITKEHA
jgi:hypothetical protein